MYVDIESNKPDTDLLQAIIVNRGDPDRQVDRIIFKIIVSLLLGFPMNGQIFFFLFQ